MKNNFRNRKTKSEETAARPQKSKRLSSLVWIAVLWGFVRLIAEMDGISWTWGFENVVYMFGVLPATLFLFISVWPFFTASQALLRWAALLAVIGNSFLALWIFAELNDSLIVATFMAVYQLSLTVVVLAISYFKGQSKHD